MNKSAKSLSPIRGTAGCGISSIPDSLFGTDPSPSVNFCHHTDVLRIRSGIYRVSALSLRFIGLKISVVSWMTRFSGHLYAILVITLSALFHRGSSGICCGIAAKPGHSWTQSLRAMFYFPDRTFGIGFFAMAVDV